MKNPFPDNKKILNKLGLIVLILLCMFSFVWFIGTYNTLHRSGELIADYSIRKGHPTRLSHSVSVNSINTWMTFDYINVIFKLPKNYLQTTFNITDPRYPNIRVGNYIKQHNLNLREFMNSLELAITNYPSQIK
jgi:hypothetical protein